MIRALEGKRKDSPDCRVFYKTLDQGPEKALLGAVLWAEPTNEGELAMDYLAARLDQLAEEQLKRLPVLSFDEQKALLLRSLSELDKELSYIGRRKDQVYRAGLSILYLQNGSYFCFDCEEGHVFLFSQGLLRCISNGADRTMTPFGTGEAHPFPSDGVLPSGALLILSAKAFSAPLHRSLEEALAKPAGIRENLCVLTEKMLRSSNALLLFNEEDPS